MSDNKVKIGNLIFDDIESNSYLNNLYEKALVSYAKKTLQITNCTSMLNNKEINDLLRFADLLSKSNYNEKSEHHKMWAQEIIVLLNYLLPQNNSIKAFGGSVFSNTDNSRGLCILGTNFNEPFYLSQAYLEYKKDYLRIPSQKNMHFLSAQKKVYDHLNDRFFSYSAPTSMGKSFLMRMFIKEQIENNISKNFAILIPTKALINEVSQKIIREDLKELLEQHNYKVITASSDIALEGEHNFIYIVTPERLLYMLIAHPNLKIDYLFIDEAHKLSAKNSRAPFYYKTVDMLNKRTNPPKFIFASPNVPNPEVYLRLLTDISNEKYEALKTSFSPVTQIKFLLDLKNKDVSVYNPHSEATINIANIKDHNATLENFLYVIEYNNRNKEISNTKQTIVFFNSKNKAVQTAQNFAKKLNTLNDKDLDILSRDIASAVHKDYYLADIVKKGVAYHIGYLPSSIRMRIEDLFRQGKITTLFCTSTLLEGVNLPADNLFITTKKIFTRKMTPVDFRNLIGRVGRIEYNLYGNVIFVTEQDDKSDESEFIEMLKTKVPEQILSVEAGAGVLTNPERKYIIETLKAGKVEIKKRNERQSEESYELTRKFSLILAKDIVSDNSSLVRKSFSDLLSSDDEILIRNKLKENNFYPDDDINISADQSVNLSEAIRNGLHYPERKEGHFNYNDVMDFLEKLCDIFKWEQYEYATLGKVTDGKHKKLRWYGVLLLQWISGFGLNNIIKKGIEFHRENPNNFWINKTQMAYYQDTKEFRNILFADTLEVIDNIILFSLSNYFLKFSNEYKRIHGVTSFSNDWYEYVEYGTTNPSTILLQRIGFSRETASYINKHPEYIIELSNTNIKLSESLIDCPNHNVKNEALNVILNMPEAFIKNKNS